MSQRLSAFIIAEISALSRGRRVIIRSGRGPSRRREGTPTYGRPTDFHVILTNKPKIAIISSGTARTAGGWLHHPKGGAAYADHITYRTVHRDDHCEKQKPPLGKVTVSRLRFELLTNPG